MYISFEHSIPWYSLGPFRRRGEEFIDLLRRLLTQPACQGRQGCVYLSMAYPPMRGSTGKARGPVTMERLPMVELRLYIGCYIGYYRIRIIIDQEKFDLVRVLGPASPRRGSCRAAGSGIGLSISLGWPMMLKSHPFGIYLSYSWSNSSRC